MAQLVVRNLDDELKERLRRAAAAHGHSMEEEARAILHRALPEGLLPKPTDSHVGLGTRIHALFMDLDAPDDYFAAVEGVRSGGPSRETALPRAAETDG